MKKKVLLLVSILLLSTLILSAISAADELTAGTTTPATSATTGLIGLDSAKAKATTCLSKIIPTNCSNLSSEERIFAALATGKCGDLIIDSSQDKKGECWPAGACSLTQTSQAILALNRLGKDSTLAKYWLKNQTTWVGKIEWYIQIESISPVECTIDYSTFSYKLNIGADKKLSKGAGLCLFLEEGDPYKLKVRNSQACYNHTYSISCNDSFFTTKLYKKTNGETLYVSEKVKSSTGGTVSEEINSLCFGDSKGCNYLGSLWGTLVLSSLKEDVSKFIPYLITFSDEAVNQKYLPNAFLYILTNYPAYRNNLLSQRKTISGQTYWEVSGVGNKYYDSALALLALKSDTSSEKGEAINWLIKSQEPDGCWNSANIRDSSFISYSLWQGVGGSSTPSNLCNPANCLSAAACADSGGTDVPDKTCSSVSQICCSVVEKTCSQKGGMICDGSSQVCKDNNIVPAPDLIGYQICCKSGYCSTKEDDSGKEYTCELNEGICSVSCKTGEQETSDYTCENYEDVCCIEEETQEPSEDEPNNSGIYITLLIILILLVVLAIVFKDKLKILLIKLKTNKKGKDKKDSGSSTSRGMPPFPPRPPFGPSPGSQMPRRIVPNPRPVQPATRAPANNPNPVFQRRLVKQSTNPELEEVLRKLKEMGK